MGPPDACDRTSAEPWTTQVSPHPSIPGQVPPRKDQIPPKFPEEPLGLVGPEMALIEQLHS